MRLPLIPFIFKFDWTQYLFSLEYAHSNTKIMFKMNNKSKTITLITIEGDIIYWLHMAI